MKKGRTVQTPNTVMYDSDMADIGRKK